MARITSYPSSVRVGLTYSIQATPDSGDTQLQWDRGAAYVTWVPLPSGGQNPTANPARFELDTKFLHKNIPSISITLIWRDSNNITRQTTVTIPVQHYTISISGPDNVNYGSSANYSASISPSTISGAVIQWNIDGINTVTGSSTSVSTGDPVITNGIIPTKTIRVNASYRIPNYIFDGLTKNVSVTPNPPNVALPSATIQGVNDVEQGQSFDVSVNPSGGTYDTIEYNYSVTPSNAGTFSDNTSKKTTFTASPRDSNTTARISCAITCRGTGTEAYDGTYATRTVTSSSFTITTNQAVAPDIDISGVKAVLKGETLNLEATPTGGIYNSLTYEWRVSTTKLGFAPEDLGNFSPTTTSTEREPGSTTFTADQVPENIPATITLTVTAERNNNGITTTDIKTFTRDFTILSERREATLDVVKIVGSPLAFFDTPQIYSIETSGDESYDELVYKWSVEPGYVGDFEDANAAIGKLNIETRQKLSSCIVCNVTARGTGDAAVANSEVTRRVTFIIRLLSSKDLDALSEGSWKEIPQPGIKYRLDPSTLPLIGEFRQNQNNLWKFMTTIESVDLDSDEINDTKSFWEDRKAGNNDTVLDPSFVGRTIKDLTFTQNRMVFLTTDSVVASFAGIHGLFWGASAEGTIPSDPIDLDIGNSVAANCLTSQGHNLWILTPEQQFALYPADVSGGWTPQNMRLDKMSQIAIELDLRIWSNGQIVCGGHPNGLLLDLSLDLRGVQPLDISARCPDLLNKPKLSPKEIKEGKIQWDGKTSEVIARCFLPSTNTQIALQRERPSEDYDRNTDILRTRLLITRQIRETFCWSYCLFQEIKETDVYEPNYEIMTITQHQENLYMLVREKDENGQFHIHLESLYLGDQDREEDCCDHRIIGEEHDEPTTYRSCVQFSAPVLYENAYGELTPTRNTNFNVKSYVIHFKPKEDEDFEFNVISTPNGRKPNITTYNNIALGYSKEPFLRRDVPEWDSFEVPCNYEAKFFNVCIESYSKIPFEILSGEWSALISGPERRRR